MGRDVVRLPAVGAPPRGSSRWHAGSRPEGSTRRCARCRSSRAPRRRPFCGGRPEGAGAVRVPALRPAVLARWAGCVWRPCDRCAGGGLPGAPCGRCGAGRRGDRRDDPRAVAGGAPVDGARRRRRPARGPLHAAGRRAARRGRLGVVARDAPAARPAHRRDRGVRGARPGAGPRRPRPDRAAPRRPTEARRPAHDGAVSAGEPLTQAAPRWSARRSARRRSPPGSGRSPCRSPPRPAPPLAPGARVNVVASTGEGLAGRTRVVVADAEVLATAEAAPDGDPAAAGEALLRVTSAQALR